MRIHIDVHIAEAVRKKECELDPVVLGAERTKEVALRSCLGLLEVRMLVVGSARM